MKQYETGVSMKRNKKKRIGAEAPQEAGSATPSPLESGKVSLWHNPWVHALLILGLGIAVYAKTNSFPFFFDDVPYLKLNPVIRSFSFITDPESVLHMGIYSDVKNNVLLRPVAYASFALNYTLHGLDVWGYHLLNLILHLCNGLLVYLLVRLVLRTPAMEGSGDTAGHGTVERHRFLPLFCALLFTVHPLQTQAVTYIIQRFVPLCTFFTLGSLVLYGYARHAAQRPVRVACYLFSLAACILAMLSKEIAFTIPIMIALYEIAFLDGAPRKRAARLVPFLLSMAIIPSILLKLSALTDIDDSESIADAINLVNFKGTSSWDYLITQFGVMTRYLRLLVLPINQNFDYDYQLQTQFFTPAVLLPLFILLVIAVTGVWLLIHSRKRRNPEAGLCALTAFGIFWFFITQAVVSSIVPIEDLIFEHRAYLPSIGFFMATLAGVALLYNTRKPGKSLYASPVVIGILSIAVLVYASAGFKRNSIWEDKITFWRDVVSKSPNKARPHVNLGLALLDEPHQNLEMIEKMKKITALGLPGLFPQENSGPFKPQLSPYDQDQVDNAIHEFRSAIRIRPKWMAAHLDLGDALLLKGDLEEAKKEIATAQAIAPKSFTPYLLLGKLYEHTGDNGNAGKQYLEAIRLAPKNHSLHILLAELYAKEGNYAEARREFEIAWQLFPDIEVKAKLEEMIHKSQQK